MGDAATKLDHYHGDPFRVSIETFTKDGAEVRKVKCDRMMDRVEEKYRTADFDVVLDEKWHDKYALGVFIYDDFFDELEVTIDRTPYRVTFWDKKKPHHATAIRFGIDLVPLREDVPMVRALDPIIVNE